jgi:hypothetical protein
MEIFIAALVLVASSVVVPSAPAPWTPDGHLLKRQGTRSVVSIAGEVSAGPTAFGSFRKNIERARKAEECVPYADTNRLSELVNPVDNHACLFAEKPGTTQSLRVSLVQGGSHSYSETQLLVHLPDGFRLAAGRYEWAGEEVGVHSSCARIKSRALGCKIGKISQAIFEVAQEPDGRGWVVTGQMELVSYLLDRSGYESVEHWSVSYAGKETLKLPEFRLAHSE